MRRTGFVPPADPSQDKPDHDRADAELGRNRLATPAPADTSHPSRLVVVELSGVPTFPGGLADVTFLRAGRQVFDVVRVADVI
jgi:hypothetical protein